MRTIFVFLVAGLIVLLGGTSYAADLRSDHKRTHARGAGTFRSAPACCRAGALLWRLRSTHWPHPFRQRRAAALHQLAVLAGELRGRRLRGLLSGYAILCLLGLWAAPRPERAVSFQTSTLAASAFCSMKSRRGSTNSPINSVKMLSASSPSFTCSSERAFTSSVVSHSCSGFISPRPL